MTITPEEREKPFVQRYRDRVAAAEANLKEIERDLADFDGDRRGIAAAAQHAREELRCARLNIPGPDMHFGDD